MITKTHWWLQLKTSNSRKTCFLTLLIDWYQSETTSRFQVYTTAKLSINSSCLRKWQCPKESWVVWPYNLYMPRSCKLIFFQMSRLTLLLPVTDHEMAEVIAQRRIFLDYTDSREVITGYWAWQMIMTKSWYMSLTTTTGLVSYHIPSVINNKNRLII